MRTYRLCEEHGRFLISVPPFTKFLFFQYIKLITLAANMRPNT